MAVKTKKQKIALLTTISGMSDVHAKDAVEILGIETLDGFIAAGEKGDLQKISGVGAKREARMLAAALAYKDENPETPKIKPATNTQKKKENPSLKKTQADSIPSSQEKEPAPQKEKLTLPALSIRLLKKVILKTIRNR